MNNNNDDDNSMIDHGNDNHMILDGPEDSDDNHNKMLIDDSEIITGDGKKVTVFGRFLNERVVNLHSKFNDQHPDMKISYSSFWKNIPKYFLKDGKKRTDLCHICELGKNAIKMRKKCTEPKVLQQVINFNLLLYYIYYYTICIYSYLYMLLSIYILFF
jgi:hypothetical protein